MSNTIWIVPIEPIDSRYTKQWYENIPVILQNAIAHNDLEYTVKTVDGRQPTVKTTEGAFLDFGATNAYKASQAETISIMFSNGEVKAGDKFLVTDAWNFVVTPIKYMSDLLDIPVEIHGIWHAGAYDPTDILGYKMQKPWPAHVEKSWFYCCDANYYATDFHKDMFLRNLEIPAEDHWRAVRSGQPHTPIIEKLTPYQSVEKTTDVIWPHRYNDDKQPEIVEDMGKDIADIVITQKMDLTKDEFYRYMGSSKVVFSCSLHENLGISMMEGVLAGSIPVVPDRASYSEMYLDCFKYPSEWTSSLEAYEANRSQVIAFVKDKVDNYDTYMDLLEQQRDVLVEKFLQPTAMVNNILGV